jgi:hypothetical protein
MEKILRSRKILYLSHSIISTPFLDRKNIRLLSLITAFFLMEKILSPFSNNCPLFRWKKY